MKTKATLSGVSETLIIPLWAKGVEYERKDPLIVDKISHDLMQKFEFDFSKLKNAKASQVGCCVRAKIIDDEVNEFIATYPDAVIIQLGAGWDARYERLNRPQITHWYDLDLEQVIESRRELLQESSRNSYISASLFDFEAWIPKVKSHGKPVMIVLEGVLMYFEPSQVRLFFKTLCEQFDEVRVVFDMLTYAMVGREKFHDAAHKFADAKFKWSLLDSHDMKSWDPKIKVISDKYLSDHSKGRFPLVLRLLYKIPYLYKRLNQRVVSLKIK